MRHLNLALLFGFVLVPAGSLIGQTTFATITGTVTDTTGAIVLGAGVSAINTGTNTTVRTQANEAGIYTIPQLREGRYVLRVGANGFKEAVVQDLLIESSDYRRLDVRLELGQVVESVEVSGGATLIETERASITDTRTSDQLLKLPLRARTIKSFFMLSPGVAANPNSAAITFFGARSGWSTTDGTTNIGNSILMESLDWVEEVKINAVTPTAEFNTTGVTTIISKSGTNDLHGSAFEWYSSPFLRTRNPFATERASGVLHEFGGSVGGPVYLPKLYNGRNRTFFFTSLYVNGGGPVSSLLRPTVPLEAWRKGDFSALGGPIRNPITGEVYRDGRIPQSQINPVAKKIQDRFYPLPNFGDPNVLSSGNFNQQVQVPWESDHLWASRLDHRFGNKDSIFARHQLARTRRLSWGGPTPAFGPYGFSRRARSITVGETHTFGPSLINEFRFGHTYGDQPEWGAVDGQPMARELGLQGLAPDLPNISGVIGVAFGGIGITGLSQPNWSRPGFLNEAQEFYDQVSFFRGRHGLKAGMNIRRARFSQRSVGGCIFGCVTFANTYSSVPGVTNSGHPYADFLFGTATSMRRDYFPLQTDLRNWVYDVYFQDDWKVTNRLTVNVGLRYEYHPTDRDVNGRLAMFDAARGAVVVTDRGLAEVSNLFPKGYVDVVAASTAGLPAETLIRTDKNNISPRFGFAYRPFSNANSVIRGGYGIYHDPSVPRRTSAANAPPFTIGEPAYTNTQPVPTVVLPRVYPSAGATGGPSTVSLPSSINPDLKVPYTQQWNFTLEHQRWGTGFRLSYIGTSSRQMTYQRNINAPVVDGRLYVNKPRPFPKYPAIGMTDNGGTHVYHSYNVEVEHKMKNGLWLQASYTLARAWNDVPLSGDTIENPFDRRRDYGPEISIPLNRFVAASMYQLPLGRGRKWLSRAPKAVDAILGAWEVSATYTAQSGVYLTPVIQLPDPTGTAFTTGPNRPLVTIRPDRLRDARLPDPTINRWFDPGAYAAPPTGRYGNSAKATVNGPGVNIWQMAAYKYIAISENPRVPKVRLGFQATNFFNHPNWSNPEVRLDSLNTVGTIRGVGGSSSRAGWEDFRNRELRLEIRVEW